jgi:hypothetical protein
MPMPEKWKSRRGGVSEKWRRRCRKAACRPPTSCCRRPAAGAGTAGPRAGRSRWRRSRHGRGPPGPGRSRGLRCPGARAGLAAGAGLPQRRARGPGRQLLRRLAHAAAAGARADVPGRPAAAGRADQPPRPRRAGVAGELAQALRGHLARDQPRPRVPRCRHARDGAPRRRPLSATAATTRAFEEMRAERLRRRRPRTPGSRNASPTCSASSTASRPRPPRPSQAQSRVKALARMERLAPVLTASDFDFEFREPLSLPNPMLAFDGLACGYGDTAIVAGIDRSVLAGPAHRHPGRQRPGQVDPGEDDRRHAGAAGRPHHRRQGPGPSATSRSRNSTCCTATTAR